MRKITLTKIGKQVQQVAFHLDFVITTLQHNSSLPLTPTSHSVCLNYYTNIFNINIFLHNKITKKPGYFPGKKNSRNSFIRNTPKWDLRNSGHQTNDYGKEDVTEIVSIFDLENAQMNHQIQ